MRAPRRQHHGDGAQQDLDVEAHPVPDRGDALADHGADSRAETERRDIGCLKETIQSAHNSRTLRRNFLTLQVVPVP